MSDIIDQFGFDSVRVSEAKKELSGLVDAVHLTQTPVEIRGRGKRVYMISEDDMEELAELRLAFGEIEEEDLEDMVGHILAMAAEEEDKAVKQGPRSQGKVIAFQDLHEDH